MYLAPTTAAFPADAPGVIPDVYGEIARTGLLGVLLVGAFLVIRKLYTDLSAEKASRLEDAKAIVQMVRETTAATVAATESQNDRNRAIEALSAAVSKLAGSK